MRRASLLAATALVAPAWLGVTAGITPALAACNPNPATANNQTIICTGRENNGFDGSGFDGLTVNIRRGATVVGNGVQAVFIDNGNRVTNNGTVVFDDSGGGIDALAGNSIVNNGNIFGGGFFGISATDGNNILNNGTIDVAGFGIIVEDNNQIINTGLIRVGDVVAAIEGSDNNVVINTGRLIAGDIGVGILVRDGNDLVLNTGSIRVGMFGAGIVVRDNNLSVNAGLINVGAGGSGIAARFDNVVLNAGIINVGEGGLGVELVSGNTATNTGVIIGGEASAGIVAVAGNRLINEGFIQVDRDGIGIIALDNNVEIVNNGTIVTGREGVGLAVRNGNLNVHNNGTIAVGPGGIGVVLGDDNAFRNTGLIQARSTGAGDDGVAIEAGTNNFVDNAGTIDGIIDMSAGGFNGLLNSGLITITDPRTTIGGRAHVVDGGFRQTRSGTLALRVKANGAHDRLNVTGTANLAGKLRAVVQRELYGKTTVYNNVVTTGGFTGGLQATTSSPFFRARLDPDGTDFDLVLTRIALNAASGVSPNHQQLARALENEYSVGLTGNAATLYTNIFAASGADVFGFLSGEGTAAAQSASFSSGSLFQSTMLNQISLWLNSPAAGASAPLSYAAAPPAESGHEAFAALQPAAPARQPWQVWTGGFVGNQKLGGDTSLGTADASQTSAGGALGVNYSPSSDLLLGFSAGASSAAFSVDERATSGDVKGIHFGAFGVKTWDAFYVAGALGYARLNNKTERSIFSGGPTETVTGEFSSDLLTGRLEAGWRHHIGGYAVTPFIALEAARLWQESYTETSTGVSALSYDANSITSLPASLGLQIDNRLLTANGQTLQSFARVAWVHEFKATRDIQASFVSIPAVSFTAQGPSAAEDVAKVTAGAKLSLTRSASVFVSLDGEFSGDSQSYSGSGGLSWVW